MNETIESIKTKALELIEDIKKYSEAQSELWQQIPWWANQADGRSGFSDNYNRAFNLGFWPLRGSTESGYYPIFVDLENGKLVSPWNLEDYALDKDILNLANSPEQIDSALLLNKIKEEAKSPDKLSDLESYRLENIDRLGLTPFAYKRHID